MADKIEKTDYQGLEKSRADSAAQSRDSYMKDPEKSHARSRESYMKDPEKSRADSELNTFCCFTISISWHIEISKQANIYNAILIYYSFNKSYWLPLNWF